jgi:hypothetical protein
MSILIIKGPAKSGKSLLANSMRNTAISSGCGALMIDDHADGEAVHHLEKIIQGDRFVPGTAAADVKWKKDPKVILVNSGEDRLKEFETICPGFTTVHGPVSKMNVGPDA